jgi:hypothetical protein
MKRPLSFLGALLLAATTACTGPKAPEETPQAKQASAVMNRILDELVLKQPANCRSLGMRKECDGKVADYSAAGIQKRIAFLEAAHKELEPLDVTYLGDDGILDKKLIDLAIREELYRLVDVKLWAKRPSFYEELFALDSYLTRDYAPLDERVKSLKAHVTAALPQTKHIFENLKGPLPKTFVETDIGIYKGYAEYLRGDVVKILEDVKDPALKSSSIELVKKLADEAQAVHERLDKSELGRADASHVLGVERYKKLLSVQEALDIDLGEFEKMAQADLEKNKTAYEELQKSGLVEKRPTGAELLTVARTLVVDSKAFIEKKNVVTIPKEGKLQVSESPPYMRWNSAFLNAPGPFDPATLTSYYYITLPNPEWSSREQEEYVMTYGSLSSTSVHEVFPGHFLQGMRARKAPTRAQLMLGSYSFIEGWAHYAEQMMVEEGFGAELPENRLGQLSDALLRNCRFTVSIALHTKNMTPREAEDRFVKDCKQDRATAKQQAARGTFDPGYFAYTLGKLQIIELREEAKEMLGKKFDLKKFHDALLSHGSPPVPLIRDRVLHEIGAAK